MVYCCVANVSGEDDGVGIDGKGGCEERRSSLLMVEFAVLGQNVVVLLREKHVGNGWRSVGEFYKIK